MIKLQWIASIWHQNNPKCWDTSQNIQNNANQWKWSNYNAWHRFDYNLITFVVLRQNSKVLIVKTSNRCHARLNDQNFWVTSLNYKSDQTTKVIKAQWIASIWRLDDQNIWVTSQNYESDQIILHCIDLTSKRSKLLSYVPKLQK